MVELFNEHRALQALGDVERWGTHKERRIAGRAWAHAREIASSVIPTSYYECSARVTELLDNRYEVLLGLRGEEDDGTDEVPMRRGEWPTKDILARVIVRVRDDELTVE